MFTHNQVRQFYVANAYESAASGLDTAGDIILVEQDGDMYFNYVNPDGEILRTDLIDKNKIMSITVTPADKQKYISKATVITLKNDVLDSQNSNNPVAGEDYMVNVKAWNPKYQSETSPVWKYGVMHTTSATTPSDFYKGLAKSLAANIDKNIFVGLKVYGLTASGDITALTTGNTTEVNADTVIPTGTTFYGIVVDEKEPCIYDANGDYVYVNGDETLWADTKELAGMTIFENGQKIADMEKFYHGERGDIYREGSFPYNWENKMVANPASKYDTIDIHYYWNGANHAIQKSEKDITIACASGVATSIVTAINGACSGLTGWSNLTYNATGNISTVILSK